MNVVYCRFGSPSKEFRKSHSNMKSTIGYSTCVIVGLLIAFTAALPIAPITWTSPFALVYSVANNHSLYEYHWNRSVARFSPLNGSAIWFSEALDPFVLMETIQASDSYVTLYSNTTGGPMIFVFDAITGAALGKASVTTDCSQTMDIYGDTLVCVAAGSSTVVMYSLPSLQQQWSSAMSGIYSGSGSIFSSNNQVLYYTGFSPAGWWCLVVVTVGTWDATFFPNITSVSIAVNNAVIVVTQDYHLHRLDLSRTSFSWSNAEVASSLSLGTGTQLYIAADVVVAFVTSTNAPRIFCIDPSTGSVFGNLSVPIFDEPFAVIESNGYLVIGYQNDTGRIAYNTLDPVQGVLVATGQIPGTRVVLAPTKTFGQTIVVVNGQGFAQFSLPSLAPVSYNLDLPNIFYLHAFPNVPTQGQTTVVFPGQMMGANATAVVFS